MTCLIYKITNIINDKIYVGQTWGSLKSRLIKHKSRSSNCVKLYNAINKLGIHLSAEIKQKIAESNLGNHKGKTWKIINGKRVWMEKQ